MRSALKLLPLLLLAGGLTFTAVELKQVSGLADGLGKGELPAALQPAAAADETGTLAKLVEAQQAQLGRLSAAGRSGDAAAPAVFAAPQAPEPARRGPMVVLDTNSGPAVKVSRGAGPAPERGGAVLLDQKTGERLEIAGTRPVRSETRQAAEKAVAAVRAAVRAPEFLSEAGDLEARKRRAYGVLVGTVLAAAALLVLIRRAVKG